MSTTDPITAIGATGQSDAAPPGTTPSGVDNPGAKLDRDAFLKLLVAQLKYQDPTKPTDASAMLAQSAQLTMVDRLNELVAAVTASTTSQRLSLAGTIVGRDISFIDPDGYEVTETVTSAKVGPDGVILVAGQYEVPYEAITAVRAPVEEPVAT